MPAVSEKQRRFFGAELVRKRAGKKTKTGMTEEQLHDFAIKKVSRKSRHGSGPFLTKDMQRGYKRV